MKLITAVVNTSFFMLTLCHYCDTLVLMTRRHFRIRRESLCRRSTGADGGPEGRKRLFIYPMWERQTPMEDILNGLNRAVQAGKARYIGISNCVAWQPVKANALAEKRGVSRTEISIARLLTRAAALWRGLPNSIPSTARRKLPLRS